MVQGHLCKCYRVQAVFVFNYDRGRKVKPLFVVDGHCGSRYTKISNVITGWENSDSLWHCSWK